MPRTPFYIKSGDTHSTLQYQITDRDGAPVDLSGVSGVTFSMDGPDGTSVVSDVSATIETPSEGEVSYTFASGDTATAGRHAAEFEVTFDDTTTERYPIDHNIAVHVLEGVN